MDRLSDPRPRMEIAAELIGFEATARSVAQMLDEVKAAFVVVWTENEGLCRLLSKARIDVPILSLCPDKKTAQQLSLCYGVISQHQPEMSSYEQWVDVVEKIVEENNWASKGEQLLMIPPLSVLSKNTAGAIILHTIS